jgi:hypothetical protein
MSKSKTRDYDRERATTLICKAIVDAPIESVRKMLCLMVGHPPVVEVCFGYQNCARCGEQVGDMLGGPSTLAGKRVVGHDDAECLAIKLTPTDLLLMPAGKLPAKATKVAV